MTTLRPDLDTPQEKKVIFSVLILILLSFFSFGWFHLGTFETTDEHLWKYDRIGQYWEALGDRDWEQTYINDKPGITVALISGVGLLFEPHPEDNERRAEPDPIKRELFHAFNIDQSEKTNITFRLPVLIFSTISLLLFFWLAYRAFASRWIALTVTLLIAGNPILLGMSQIINPDSFFWIFGGLGALAYLALLETQKRSFVVWCGIFTGFALLSKYTAFTLFLLYALMFLASLFFPDKKPSSETSVPLSLLRRSLFDLIGILLLSFLVFVVFLPATFFHPEYLLKGISQFFAVKYLLLFMIILVGSIGSLFLFFRSFLKKTSIDDALTSVLSLRRFLLMATIVLFLGLLSLSVLNSWTGQTLIPIDALRDTAYTNEPQAFNFRPLIPRSEPELIKNTKLYFMNAYPLVFSLAPLLLGLILFVSIQGMRNRLEPRTSRVLLAILSFILLYLVSTLMAKVVTNVRYIILFYPLLAIAGALALSEYGTISRYGHKRVFLFGTLMLLITSLLLFYANRPFYFSYTNPLLPRDFSIHDSWGHGSYEAASYLNTLPNAENLVIWSNSSTVCRFFVGQCLRSRKIDLARVTPDYFVLSKRGFLKVGNHFTFLNNPTPSRDTAHYLAKLENGFVWQVLLNNRPDNYVKIIPFER